jgi:hypothetical protein
MTAPTSEFALDVSKYQLGAAVIGEERGIGIRFFLEDGRAIQFVLLEELAKRFSTEFQDQLKMLSASVARH